jgi:hypothetical protein
MEKNKNTIARERRITNQEALVKRLVNKTVKPKKIIVPGGKTLMKDIDLQTLEAAMYNWFRGCSHFTDVRVSLATDLEGMNISETKVYDFDTTSPQPEWVTHKEGKMFLARTMAEAMFSNKCVGVRADKNGVFVLTDSSGEFPFDPEQDSWGPNVVFTPQRKKEYGI